MPRVNITPAEVRAHAETEARVEMADTVAVGLRLRLSPGGAAVWRVVYRVAGSHEAPRSYTLGPYSPGPQGLTVARARAEAKDITARARLGQDPQRERVAARRDARRREAGATLDALVRAFLEATKGDVAATTHRDWTRYLLTDAAPLLDRAAVEVQPEAIERLITAKRKAAGPVAARRLYQVLRQAYAWARRSREWRDVMRGIASPCDDVLVVPPEPPPRDRVYSQAELRQIVAGVAAYTSLSLLVRLLLYTGVRPGEARGAAWAEVDLPGAVWRLPPERTKARAPHTVPLSPQAVAVFEAARAAYPGERLVLPEWAGQWRTISRLRRERELSDQRRSAKKKVPAVLPADFRLHDLRRTVRQHMADMGIDDDVAEAVLGHVPPRMRKTYAPREPVARMRAALVAWGARLEAILAKP